MTLWRKFHDSAQLVVPVAKDVRSNFELVAENPFDRIATALELGINILDGNPRLGPPQRVQSLTGLATRHLLSRSSGMREPNVSRRVGAGAPQHTHFERLDYEPGPACPVSAG